jgi:5-methylcytosine-specific restriction endonuclease McrA
MRPSREDIYRRDGYRCCYCGFDGTTFEGWVFLQLDHFKPTARGGKDDPENLITCCVVCNNMKWNTEFATIEDARSYIHAERTKLRIRFEMLHPSAAR